MFQDTSKIKNAEALVKTLRVCDDFGLRCKKHLAI